MSSPGSLSAPSKLIAGYDLNLVPASLVQGLVGQLNERDCLQPLIMRFVRIFRERGGRESRIVEQSWGRLMRLEPTICCGSNEC